MIQQTIQEVKFEDIILAKKQRQARKTNKLRHWLEYLSMLEENQSYEQKNKTIAEMHKMLILREDFWIRQVKRVLNDTNLTTASFQFVFQALQDGFYIKVAMIICTKLFEAYNNQQIRLNYVIAKIQTLIQKFNYDLKQGAYFFQVLLQVYVKTNNVKKIRETYKRQIQMGFDDYDITYTNFEKLSQNHSQSVSVNFSELLQGAKRSWQSKQIFLQEQLPRLMNSSEFDNNELLKDKKNIKYCLIYLQDMNSARIDEQKYSKLLSLLCNDKQRLWYLRRLALSETHQLVPQYFQCLELSSAQDDQIISSFKISFNWQKGIQYEKLYLSFLIRRINKHLSKPQDQQYNDEWGNKVQFFRNQISEFISRQRSNPKQQQRVRQEYYYLWIQVETVLVRQAQTVQKIFENLLAWGPSQEIYVSYAKYMIRLNDLSKARFIFSKTCQAYSYGEDTVKEYQQFLSVYGSLEEAIKLRQKIKAKPKSSILKQQSKIKEIENNHEQKTKMNLRQISRSIVQEPKQIQTKEIQKVAQKVVVQELKTHDETQSQRLTQNGQKNFKRSASVEDTTIGQTNQGNIQKKKIHLDEQNTLFAKDIDKNWSEADIMLNLIYKQSVNQVRIVDKQKSKFCYIQFQSQQIAQKQLNHNRSPLKLAFSRPPSKSDDCTLFLCNLPTQTSRKEITQLIPQSYRDAVKDIRSHEKHGKKTAYIQFHSEQIKDQVLLVLKRQKIKIKDKYIIAMSCESNNKNKQKKNRTIFLKNISFKCRQKEIRKFFAEKDFQDINQVFIPKDQKTNKLKGFAYVQFLHHEDADKAIQLGKGQMFQRQFTIHRSDRGITHQSSYERSNHQAGNGQKGEKYQKKTKQSASKDQKKPQQSKQKANKEENKKSNNFFSNFFS